jgi:hypothetical protein
MELLHKWENYARQNGLNPQQILGLAYYNGVLPTVLAHARDKNVLAPLGQVINELGKASSEGANLFFLYRELYFAACIRDSHLKPLEISGTPNDFFSQENNPYIKVLNKADGLFLDSELTINLLQRLGLILDNHNLAYKKAFEIGHHHANFILQNSSGKNFTRTVTLTNKLPHYLAAIIDMIPDQNSLALGKEIWIFSKIFLQVLKTEVSDNPIFSEWLWNLHNAIFYENKPGSTKITSEWALGDPNFEINMIRILVTGLPSYYNSNKNVGNAQLNRGKSFETWEEFFILVNKRMREDFQVESPVSSFINIGEMCNYLAFKFIASVLTVLEFGKL